MPILNMIAQGSGGGGGGNIGEPLNLTVIPGALDATITWEDNEIGTIPPTTFQKSELVRKIGSAPTSPSDGTLVVTETVKDTYKVSGYVDSGLTYGTTYYYRVFSYSDLGGISYCDAVSITANPGWTPDPTRTIFYYDFEDSNNRLADSSGNNNDATGTTAITYTTVGTQTVAETTGNPCGISIDGTLGSSIGSGDFAISFWTYFVNPAKSDGYPMLFGMSGNSNKGPNIFFNPYNAYSMGRAVLWRVQGGSGQHPGSIDATTLLNGWHHLVMTRNNGTLTAYIDGNVDATWSDSTAFQSTIDVQCLLSRPNDEWQSFGSGAKGDKYILENVAWSATDVQDYYDQTKGDYGIS